MISSVRSQAIIPEYRIATTRRHMSAQAMLPVSEGVSTGSPRYDAPWDAARGRRSLLVRGRRPEMTVVKGASPTGIARYVPILGWLPHYKRAWLVVDVMAGLSVWALLVPSALAYSSVAGVPVQYGLYTALAALLAYAVFGTSKQVVTGPSATVAAVSFAVVAPIVGEAAMGTEKAVPYTAAVALTAGVLYIALGIARMGWVSNFLSRAVMEGFILGFAIGIIIEQSYKLIGVDKVEGTFAQELIETLKQIPDANMATLAVGATSLALLLLGRFLVPKLPRALIVTAFAIVAVGALDLADRGVSITGNVPTGLFTVGLPGVGWDQLGALVAGAFSVIFVGYSESLASGREMASKHGYRIDADQELIAQGAACGAAGSVGGFVVDGSLSKTSVADAAGQKSQMASLVDAALVLATILFLASLFENLPNATLGAVVIDAMIGLIRFGPMKRYYRVNRPDWVFYVAAGLGILFFGIIEGIVIGVVLSLLLLVARASRPAARRLGFDPASGTYLDPRRHEGVQEIPGVLVVRLDGPLFFADAQRFHDEIGEMVTLTDGLTAVVIDADAISQSDTDGADIVITIAEELRASDVSLLFARVDQEIRGLWQRAGVMEAVGAERFYPTVRAAVEAITPDVEPASPDGSDDA
jgi:high affinity sulfate transporter 1